MPEDQATRYDRIAGGYARHWAPVIRPAAVRLLDELAPHVTKDARRLLDIGTGTGTLAMAAIARWPQVQVTGIDASSEMVGWAAREADERLSATERPRFTTHVAVADRLPLPDGSVDLAMSSFVFQLVPSRAAAFREARRVLRPGGVLGFVTWLRADAELDPPDRVLEEVLDEFGFDPPEADDGRGDPASARSAADGLRRAGFRDVHARKDALVHRWTPRAYVDFIEQFAEESLFDDLVDGERLALRRRLLQRVGALGPRDMRLRLPVVYVTGRAA
ncbi:MAG: class I SAM-dependent methyltransferase [Chloroflexi bacterium]|nr:class I SAM-dependent methyltransferase [Chloroflexota bacterium]